jgi:hypothetical protein
MEHAIIKALLEKYWLAETTVEEEKALADYFRGPDIDPGLAPFRDLFAYFEEEAALEAALTLGAGFESRILEQIARTEGPAAAPRTIPASPARALRRWLNPAYAAAAAVILSIGLFIMYQPSQPAAAPAIPATAATAPIKDTYEDPQQALAAIRHALLTASTRINEGKNITQKNMDRLKKLNYGQL